MKKVSVVAIVLIILVCATFLRARRGDGATATPVAAESPEGRAIQESPRPLPEDRRTARMRALNTLVSLVHENEGRGTESPPSFRMPGRDRYYDRLLEMEGRDQRAEERLTTTLMKAFNDQPDILVGATACSPNFCRVELRGSGKVDAREQWREPVMAAVGPKGLTFFVIDSDDEGNTVMNCYFGRSASWTVPDFHALGLL